MSEYFPKPILLCGNVKVELDWSNYAAKAGLKDATGVHTSKFTKQVDLASLKSEIIIGKLETIPVNLRKLSDVV